MSFDWVTARFGCSPSNAFQSLAEMVKVQVSTANELLNPERGFLVHVHPKEIIVVRSQPKERVANVIFELSRTDISVRSGDEQPSLRAIPSLSAEGECMFEVDGQIVKLWQVSRSALEPLFFGD